MRYYISGRTKGLEERFYCTSATQGAKFISWAYSMCHIFDNKCDVLKKRNEIKPRWKGLQLSVRQWTDPGKSQWEECL